jgi:hypothetical protein
VKVKKTATVVKFKIRCSRVSTLVVEKSYESHIFSPL